jgi:hypothetical protein
MRWMKWLLASLLLGTSLLAGAQQKGFTLNWFPFGFLEPDGNFTMGVEYRFGQRLAVLSDVGILFRSNNVDGRSGQEGILDGLTGYKLKPELRWYFKNRNKRNPFDGGFVALEGIYKHADYLRYDRIQVFDNQGNLAYNYFGGYRIIKDVLGASLKLGYRNYWLPNDRFGIEGYFGIGTRNKTFALRDLPPGGVFDRDFFSNRFLRFHWREGRLTTFSLGLKLLWRLTR